MTLSKLKQEGREEFEKAFENIEIEVYCCGEICDDIHMVKSINSLKSIKAFLTAQIEKAYSAGQHSMIPIAPKETVKKFKEGYQFLSKKEVRQIRLAALEDVEKGLPRKIKVEWIEDAGFNSALSAVKEVIKKLKQSK